MATRLPASVPARRRACQDTDAGSTMEASDKSRPTGTGTSLSAGARNCSAMPPSPPMPSARCPCVGHKLYEPRAALWALHASVDRLDDDRGPVFRRAGQLMAQDRGAPELDVTQVGGTDARGLHVEHHASSGWLVDIDDGYSTVAAPDRLHTAACVKIALFSRAGGGGICRDRRGSSMSSCPTLPQLFERNHVHHRTRCLGRLEWLTSMRAGRTTPFVRHEGLSCGLLTRDDGHDSDNITGGLTSLAMRRTSLNDGWTVRQNTNPFLERMGLGPEPEQVTLPHDAVISVPRSPSGSGPSAYFPGGTWEYQRTLRRGGRRGQYVGVSRIRGHLSRRAPSS